MSEAMVIDTLELIPKLTSELLDREISMFSSSSLSLLSMIAVTSTLALNEP